mmetsp:Transcript_52829/g.153705  ORF Transcript_52829/g.153705 Transcript_52829/m.153705 type:complete len:333 (-) Transcript_52829:111-1109(-)
MRQFVDRWARHRGVLVMVLMTSYSVQSLVITASKRQGGFAYDATAAVLLAELVKLLFALAMLPPEARGQLDPRRSVAYALPAVLYVLQNRLVFEALRRLLPPEYQLLNNMKLLTTSVLYRVVMRRQLRLLQWLALLLLVLGMTLATQPPEDLNSENRSSSLDGIDDASLGRWGGVTIMVIVSWCSACAGVLNEWLIKRSPNVLEANVWLYTYGAAACALRLGPSGCVGLLRFEGFTTLAWCVVLCNAVLGQSIAFLFRYADSIVKLHAVCCAMGFTTLVSVAFFGFEVRFHMLAGYIASAISLCLYYAPPELLQATDSELLAAGCGGRATAD